MKKRYLSRRTFLRMATFTGAGLTLFACSPKTEVTSNATSVAPQEPTEVEQVELSTEVQATQPSEGLPEGILDGRTWGMPLINPPARFNNIEISSNFDMNSGTKFINDETADDNVAKRFIQAMMGFSLTPKWACMGEDTCNQKWATALASGDLPEFMVEGDWKNFSQLLEADMVEDITDVWNATASDLLKEKKEFPDGLGWKLCYNNNRLLAFTHSTGGVSENDALLWIRQDWLDQVGLSVPTTVDEMYAVGKAFVDAGLAPMGLATVVPMVNWMSDLNPIFGAHGAMPGVWVKDGENLVSGSILPGIKDTLGVLQKWYEDKVIDQEFATINDPSQTAESIAGGRAGMFFGPGWCWAWPIQDSIANDPKAEWIFTDVPAGPNGKRGRIGTALFPGPVYFLKGTAREKIEAVIQYCNWIVELQDKTTKNCNSYETFSFEGYDYVIEKDEQTGLDVAKPGPVGGTYLTQYYVQSLTSSYAYPTMFFDQNQRKLWVKDYTGDMSELTPSQRNWYLSYKENPKALSEINGYSRLVETREWEFVNQFYGLPTPGMIDKGTTLSDMELNFHIAVIQGSKDVSEFDAFVEEWKAQGGDQITQEVNEWFKA
jgi:putative aldouronate transport system substrate-binding protein